MALTDFQKQLVATERNQHLRELEVYCLLASTYKGWYGDRAVKEKADRKIRQLIHKIEVLDMLQ